MSILTAGRAAALGCAALFGLPFSSYAACGCSAMTLHHAGNTGIMCSNNNLNFLSTECTKFSGASKNCATTYAYQCNLGVNTQKLSNVKPYQKTGFMPTATFSGTLTDCKIGQVLQEKITSGGQPQVNPKINPTSVNGAVLLAGHAINVDNSASNQVPQVGASGTGGNPLFGGDDYSSATSADVLFNLTGTTVSWWDNTDQSKDSQTEVATWTYEFISFVNGSAGQTSCACAFKIAVTWNGTTAPATTWTKDAALSTGCTF